MSKKRFNYREAVQEIEALIQQIESGEPDVDELSTMVKRAATLIAACRSKLKETGRELDEILEDFDTKE